MLIKHRILEELYQVQLVEKKLHVVMFEVSLDLDVLRNKVKGKEQLFNAALEAMHNTGEVYVDWKDNIALVTRDGIESLSSEKYKKDHIRWRREKVFFWLKLIGGIATFLSIITAIIFLANHFIKD